MFLMKRMAPVFHGRGFEDVTINCSLEIFFLMGH